MTGGPLKGGQLASKGGRGGRMLPPPLMKETLIGKWLGFGGCTRSHRYLIAGAGIRNPSAVMSTGKGYSIYT